MLFLMILITSYERTLIRVLRPRTDTASQRFRWISLWRAPLVTFGYFIFYMYLYLYILWSLATLSSIHICTHARKHRNLCDRSNWHWLQLEMSKLRLSQIRYDWMFQQMSSAHDSNYRHYGILFDYPWNSFNATKFRHICLADIFLNW